MDNALFTHYRFSLFAYMNALALSAQIEHCFNPHTARIKGLVAYGQTLVSPSCACAEQARACSLLKR